MYIRGIPVCLRHGSVQEKKKTANASKVQAQECRLISKSLKNKIKLFLIKNKSWHDSETCMNRTKLGKQRDTQKQTNDTNKQNIKVTLSFEANKC